jgi:transcriptional regulator with GAF, ATPase, and Fis domain
MSILKSYLDISYKSPEKQILKILIELGAQVVGAEEGSLLVHDKEGGDLVFAMTVGGESSEGTLIGQRVPYGMGIVGLAALTQEVQIGAPTYHKVQQHVEPQADGEAPKSVIAAPMLVDDYLVGVITAVTFKADKLFTSADALLYARIATVAGVVVEQFGKLATIEALEKGTRLPEANTPEEQLDFEIIDTISRLVRLRPAAKASIARLLLDVESFTGNV